MLVGQYAIADDIAEMLKAKILVMPVPERADDPYAIDDLMIRDPEKMFKISLADVLGEDPYAIADDIAEMLKAKILVAAVPEQAEDPDAIDDLMIRDPAKLFKIKLTEVLRDPYAIADDVAEMLEAGILVAAVPEQAEDPYVIDDLMIKDPENFIRIDLADLLDGAYPIADDVAEMLQASVVVTVADEIASRAVLWQVLADLQGVDTGDGDSWYAKARAWAMENGVSDGTMADRSLTREQLVTMLYNCVGKPATQGDLSAFADAAAVSDWAVAPVCWAVENGILFDTDSALDPQTGVTRTQMEAALLRFCETVLK